MHYPLIRLVLKAGDRDSYHRQVRSCLLPKANLASERSGQNTKQHRGEARRFRAPGSTAGLPAHTNESVQEVVSSLPEAGDPVTKAAGNGM